MPNPLAGSLVTKFAGPDGTVPGKLLLEGAGSSLLLLALNAEREVVAIQLSIEQAELLAHLLVTHTGSATSISLNSINIPGLGYIRFQEADSDLGLTTEALVNWIDFASLPDNSVGRWRLAKRGANHSTENSWLVLLSSGLPSLSDSFEVLKFNPNGKIYAVDDLTLTRDPTGADTTIGIKITAQTASSYGELKIHNTVMTLAAQGVDYGALAHQGIEVLWWLSTQLTANVPIFLPANPTQALHAATKDYVDTAAGSRGTYSIPNASVGETVSGLGLSFTPTTFQLQVRVPSGGLPLYACPVTGSFSSGGFDFILGPGATDSANYKLDWIAYP